MKFSKAFKYQLSDVKVSLIVYYCVFFPIEILLTCLIGVVIDNTEGTATGFDMATPVFLFILSLCIFATNFSFFNQNSISRKTMVLSCFAMFAAIAGIMLAIDAINAIVFYVGDFYENPYTTLYETIFHQFESPDHSVVDKTSDILMNLPTMSQKVIRVITNLIFNYILYFAVSVTGYFISIVFYRLSNMWRVILFIILPITVLNSAWTIYKAGKSFFDTIARWLDRNVLNNSTGFIIAMLIWTLVFAILSYIFATRARLKPQKA